MTTPAQWPADGPGTPSIGDYGLIGDMRTSAHLDRSGRVDWLCWPRFDSPPLLRRLLDPGRGGTWRLSPDCPFDSSRRYLPDTNIIESTYTCIDGAVVATDFMAVPADGAGPQLVRIVEGRSGEVPVRMALSVTDGFESRPLTMQIDAGSLVVRRGDTPVAALTCSAPIAVNADGTEAGAAVVLRPGESLVATLGPRPADDVRRAAFASRDTTTRWWQDWIAGCRLPDLRRDAVVRSALAVKLLQHEPTNALIAAPTTSLPERIGSARNWDYRYTWLRDASMAVLALQRLGRHDEAMGFWQWLGDVAAEHGDDLAVAYTVDGRPLPSERLVDLPGYHRSQPVRVGNSAGGQRQHDVYGHVLAAAAHCFQHMEMDTARPQHVLQRLADLAAQRWHEPDDSIWEIRDGRSRHTYSQMMCWLALDRAVALVDSGGLGGDRARWAAERDAVRASILDHGWNSTVGTFTGTVGGSEIDAATLVAPLIGLLPADDPRCRATRRAVTERLDDHGLLRRYRYDDGLGPLDGAFLLCTLWLADNHTLDGDPHRGLELLDRVLGTGNDLGLLAEEADAATGAPLGNFPQALTHLGVIETVHRLVATGGGDRPPDATSDRSAPATAHRACRPPKERA